MHAFDTWRGRRTFAGAGAGWSEHGGSSHRQSQPALSVPRAPHALGKHTSRDACVRLWPAWTSCSYAERRHKHEQQAAPCCAVLPLSSPASDAASAPIACAWSRMALHARAPAPSKALVQCTAGKPCADFAPSPSEHSWARLRSLCSGGAAACVSKHADCTALQLPGLPCKRSAAAAVQTRMRTAARWRCPRGHSALVAIRLACTEAVAAAADLAWYCTATWGAHAGTESPCGTECLGDRHRA